MRGLAISIVMLASLVLASCTTLPPTHPDQEHWSNRPDDLPDTTQKFDEDGMPNFGPKPEPKP